MKKRARLVALLGGLLLIFVCAWLACGINWEYWIARADGGSQFIRLESLDYSFDPRAVATSVPDGDFLTPIASDAPLPTSEPMPGLYTLREEIFYSIASRVVEKERRLQVTSVGFGTQCLYAESGLRSMSFEYIKRRDGMSRFEWDEPPYLSIDVAITTAYGSTFSEAYIYRVDYDACLLYAAAFELERPTVDYDGMTIKAMEAIHIAEMQGGRDYRDQVGNFCIISGGLYGNPPEWHVGYSKEHETALEFRIDARSGEVLEVEP